VGDAPGATTAGSSADSFCFGADAAGATGAIFSSDGAMSFNGLDDAGLIAVDVLVAHADNVMHKKTKPNRNNRMVFMPSVAP
jgi:hypothetical protein